MPDAAVFGLQLGPERLGIGFYVVDLERFDGANCAADHSVVYHPLSWTTVLHVPVDDGDIRCDFDDSDDFADQERPRFSEQ